MSHDTKTKLSRRSIMLHWIVGLMMIALLATGIYMEENGVYALYDWHKSFGVLIALFVVMRVLWRIKNGWPEHVGNYTSIEKLLSKLVHYLLIIGTILMPVSGFMMSALGGHGVDFFGLELVAANPDPANPQEVIPLNGPVAGIAHSAHGLAGDIIIIGLLLHIAGALKHHIIDKDGTLRRIFGADVA